MTTGGAGGGEAGSSGSGGESGGPVTMIETGYSEAETPEEDRAILRYIGDRATVRLVLPNKTEEVDSYDPTRVIKINFRIRTVYANESLEPDEDDDTMGEGGAGNLPQGSGGADDGGANGAGDGDADGADEEGDMPGDEGMDEASASAAMYVYDYLTSQFTVTAFTITDANAP